MGTDKCHRGNAQRIDHLGITRPRCQQRQEHARTHENARIELGQPFCFHFNDVPVVIPPDAALHSFRVLYLFTARSKFVHRSSYKTTNDHKLLITVRYHVRNSISTEAGEYMRCRADEVLRNPVVEVNRQRAAWGAKIRNVFAKKLLRTPVCDFWRLPLPRSRKRSSYVPYSTPYTPCEFILLPQDCIYVSL
jgi:hypothetical protein